MTIGLNPVAWPPLQKPQQQHAPLPPLPPTVGMRAVFLTPPSAKRERISTSVFLPRPTDAPTEPKKNPGVLLTSTCLAASRTLDSYASVLWLKILIPH